MVQTMHLKRIDSFSFEVTLIAWIRFLKRMTLFMPRQTCPIWGFVVPWCAHVSFFLLMYFLLVLHHSFFNPGWIFTHITFNLSTKWSCSCFFSLLYPFLVSKLQVDHFKVGCIVCIFLTWVFIFDPVVEYPQCRHIFFSALEWVPTLCTSDSCLLRFLNLSNVFLHTLQAEK